MRSRPLVLRKRKRPRRQSGQCSRLISKSQQNKRQGEVSNLSWHVRIVYADLILSTNERCSGLGFQIDREGANVGHWSRMKSRVRIRSQKVQRWMWRKPGVEDGIGFEEFEVLHQAPRGHPRKVPSWRTSLSMQNDPYRVPTPDLGGCTTPSSAFWRRRLGIVFNISAIWYSLLHRTTIAIISKITPASGVVLVVLRFRPPSFYRSVPSHTLLNLRANCLASKSLMMLFALNHPIQF